MTENERRSERAYRTLLVYAQGGNEDESVETLTTDLLTDLRHLADEYGIDWDEMTNRVLNHYTAETREAAR